MRRLALLLCVILCSTGMALVSSTAYRQVFDCDGSTDTFTYTFNGVNGSEIEVWIRDTTTDDAGTLLGSADYTVSATNNNYSGGGTVTTDSVYGDDYELTIVRKTPTTQTTLYPQSKTLERALDRIVRMIQEVSGSIQDRCVRFNVVDDGADANIPAGDGYLYVNEDREITLGVPVVVDVNMTTSWADVLESDANGAQRIDAKEDLGVDHVYDVRDYNATGDGVTDDTVALQAAIDATPVGGTCFFPRGYYRFTASLTRTNGIVLAGVGAGSVLIPDIDASTDAIVLGSTSSGVFFNGCGVRMLTIASSDTSVCRHVIRMNRTYQAFVEDVSVSCGHTGDALYLGGATCIKINRFTTGYVATGITGAGLPLTTYVHGVNGIGFHDETVQCNAVTINDSFINLHTGYGIYGESSLLANNIVIKGTTVQNCTLSGYNFDGMALIEISNSYTEVVPDSKFTDCQDVRLAQFKMYASGQELYLNDCDGVRITDSWIREVHVDANCSDVSVDNLTHCVAWTGDGWYKVRTFNMGRGDLPRIVADGDALNLIRNSDFQQWGSTAPVGWSKPAAVTWSKAGTDIADANNLFSDYCGKMVWTSYSSSTYTLTDFAKETLRQAGTASISAWVKTVGVPSNYPTIRIRQVVGGANVDDNTNTVDEPNKWVHLTRTAPIDPDATDIQIAFLGSGTCYLANPTLTASYQASRTWTPTIDEWGALTAYALTGDATVTAAQTGYRFSNDGAVDGDSDPNQITVTLPAAVVGQRYSFSVVDANDIIIDPYSTNSFKGGTGAGKYLRLDDQGCSVTFECMETNSWTITAGFDPNITGTDTGPFQWEP